MMKLSALRKWKILLLAAWPVAAASGFCHAYPRTRRGGLSRLGREVGLWPWGTAQCGLHEPFPLPPPHSLQEAGQEGSRTAGLSLPAQGSEAVTDSAPQCRAAVCGAARPGAQSAPSWLPSCAGGALCHREDATQMVLLLPASENGGDSPCSLCRQTHTGPEEVPVAVTSP